jgi:hypothetical protein
MIITLVGIVVDKLENKLNYLLFLISWSFVAKFDLSSYSLFLIMSLAYIVVMTANIFFRRIKLCLRTLNAVIILFIVVLLNLMFSKDRLITINMGFLVNYITIYFAIISTKSINDFEDYSFMYSLGLVSSGIVGYLAKYIAPIQAYLLSMTRVNTIIVNGKLASRFSGLNLDPNYFSINILIAISCMAIVGYYNRKNNRINSIIVFLLSILGLVTLSKMFIICYIFMIILIFYLYIKEDVKKAAGHFFGIGIVLFAVILLVGGDIYEAYLVRFFGYGNDLVSITTGRITIWTMYMEEISNSLKIILIGQGIGSFAKGTAAHSIYMTSVYYLGITGILVMLNYIYNLNNDYRNSKLLIRKMKIFRINMVPTAMILISGLALDMFAMDFFPIQIMLCILASSYCMPKLIKE